MQHDALALSIRAEDALESNDPARLARVVDEYQRDTGGRVVVVDQQGELLADSDPSGSAPRELLQPSGARAPRCGVGR